MSICWHQTHLLRVRCMWCVCVCVDAYELRVRQDMQRLHSYTIYSNLQFTYALRECDFSFFLLLLQFSPFCFVLFYFFVVPSSSSFSASFNIFILRWTNGRNSMATLLGDYTNSNTLFFFIMHIVHIFVWVARMEPLTSRTTWFLSEWELLKIKLVFFFDVFLMHFGEMARWKIGVTDDDAVRSDEHVTYGNKIREWPRVPVRFHFWLLPRRKPHSADIILRNQIVIDLHALI